MNNVAVFCSAHGIPCFAECVRAFGVVSAAGAALVLDVSHISVKYQVPALIWCPRFAPQFGCCFAQFWSYDFFFCDNGTPCGRLV